MESYIIAVRRDAREKAPPDWLKLIEDIEGLTIGGAANPFRIQVNASPEAIAQVLQRIGSFCHIEPLIYHRKAQPLR